MKRRSFMQVAGGGAVVALGGAGFLFARRTKLIALPAEPLEFFTPAEYSIFHAAAEALLTIPAGQPGVDEVKVAQKADRVMARNPVDAQKDFKKLLGLFDNALAGFVLAGNSAPFSRLSIEGRQAVLRKWQFHRLPPMRSGFVALKRLAMSCYYASPETYAGIGYPGPPEVDPSTLPPKVVEAQK
jgi:hypothetical protein